jgi:hypothetical protein
VGSRTICESDLIRKSARPQFAHRCETPAFLAVSGVMSPQSFFVRIDSELQLTERGIGFKPRQ